MYILESNPNMPHAIEVAAKIYSACDVDQELREGKVAIGGTREDSQAFFQAHPNYRVCKTSESFSVAVIRNKKMIRKPATSSFSPIIATIFFAFRISVGLARSLLLLTFSTFNVGAFFSCSWDFSFALSCFESIAPLA